VEICTYSTPWLDMIKNDYHGAIQFNRYT